MLYQVNIVDIDSLPDGSFNVRKFIHFFIIYEHKPHPIDIVGNESFLDVRITWD